MTITLDGIAVSGFIVLLLLSFIGGALFANPTQEDLDVLDRYYRNQGR